MEMVLHQHFPLAHSPSKTTGKHKLAIKSPNKTGNSFCIKKMNPYQFAQIILGVLSNLAKQVTARKECLG